ncbi:MAG: beta-galactosidase [Propionibacteriaceae bacterium]|jgi:beta-galactosidase|nr:beta-galactosidase [Propionibacteriaceae bacterium]
MTLNGVGFGGVRLEQGVLELHDEPTSLYAGAMHYWRVERDLWEPILDQVVAMGFTAVSVYIPWEIHEIEPGRFDFGQIDPRKDIDAFLTLIEAKGLRVVVRPGPQINSELTGFGYPRRLLNNSRLHARSAKGSRYVLTQVPAAIPGLSYACQEFFDETALWFDAICPILVKHAYPHGGLVAAQVDNEMAYFFGVNAYCSDYHPESLAWYREFVMAKYGDLVSVNEVYGTRWTQVDEIDPPRRFDAKEYAQIPYYADWAEYREHYLVKSIGKLAAMMRERGLGSVLLFHNYPHPLGPGGAASGFTAPFNLTALEGEVDFVGFDIYSRKELYSHVKTVTSYVVGTSRFPYIPEFIAGVWPWYLNPGDSSDEEFVTKAALMNGIRGFSRYMLVERDMWFDSPIRRDGRPREEKTTMLAKVNAMLTSKGLASMRRHDPVLLLANREYDRLEAASVLVSLPGDFLETPSGFSEYANALSVSEDALGLDQPVQLAKTEWFSGCVTTLQAAHIGYLLSDTDLALDRLSGSPIVVVSTFEYLSETVQRKLVEYAGGGGRLVIGPKAPQLGATMKPCTVLADALAGAQAATVGAGSIQLAHDQEELDTVLRALCAEIDSVAACASDARLDVVTHVDDEDPDHYAVWVANPTGEPIDATIDLGLKPGEVADLWSGASLVADDRSLAVAMEPYTINVYNMRRAR